MQLNPYLMFNGQCEEAFKFYEQALGGKIQQLSKYDAMPSEYKSPPEWNDKIMHGRIAIGQTIIMGSDAPPNQYQSPQGIQLSLTVSNPAEADRLFHALADGGQIQMPLQETFWAVRFGMLVDRFKIAWMVDCEKQQAA